MTIAPERADGLWRLQNRAQANVLSIAVIGIVNRFCDHFAQKNPKPLADDLEGGGHMSGGRKSALFCNLMLGRGGVARDGRPKNRHFKGIPVALEIGLVKVLATSMHRFLQLHNGPTPFKFELG